MLQGFSFNSMKKSILKTLIIFERLENYNFHFVIFVYGEELLAGTARENYKVNAAWASQYMDSFYDYYTQSKPKSQ